MKKRSKYILSFLLLMTTALILAACDNVIPTESIEISEIRSSLPSEETFLREGLNEGLSRESDPKTAILNTVTKKLLDNGLTDDDTVICYIPDTSVCDFDGEGFVLETEVFYETGNYLGTVLICSEGYTKAAYLMGNSDGSVYLKEPEKNSDEESVFLRIINRENPITQQEADGIFGLVQLTDPTYVASERKDLYILEEAKTALEALIVGSINEDSSLDLTVASAYRSYDAQSGSFYYWVNKRVNEESMTYDEAYEYTAGRTAIPGCSEHHNGYTLDVITLGSVLDESSQYEPYVQWIKENAYKYGFTVRYPKGTEEYTHIALYEPWHIRYVGGPTAYYLNSEDLCMEQFYRELLTEKYIEFEYDGEIYCYIYSKTDNIYIDDRIMDIEQYSNIASGVEGYVLLCRIR
jgi:LAS superfamily LD-carboxypeptidase LdcB